ncbi:MAG: hypothetical protein SFV23_09390, partial [Planctomycetaceae bacterium]|nr:hypothetical protein [Planctomycetaceae bacterium]
CQFTPGLDKTRRRFFFQAVTGIVLSTSLLVSKWLRFVHDRCQDRFWRHKRLLNQLHQGKWDAASVLASYQQKWGEKVTIDTPLVVDLSDLPRPRARKLKYLAQVRDGSEGELVSGYWCLEIYARFNKHCVTPLLLRPYSIEDPTVSSENARRRAIPQERTALGTHRPSKVRIVRTTAAAGDLGDGVPELAHASAPDPHPSPLQSPRRHS